QKSVINSNGSAILRSIPIPDPKSKSGIAQSRSGTRGPRLRKRSCAIEEKTIIRPDCFRCSSGAWWNCYTMERPCQLVWRWVDLRNAGRSLCVRLHSVCSSIFLYRIPSQAIAFALQHCLESTTRVILSREDDEGSLAG